MHRTPHVNALMERNHNRNQRRETLNPVIIANLVLGDVKTSGVFPKPWCIRRPSDGSLGIAARIINANQLERVAITNSYEC